MNLESITIIGDYKFVENLVGDKQVRVYENIDGIYSFFTTLNDDLSLTLYKEIAQDKKTQKEENLIQEIKNSLPESRLLHVVSFAGVEINGEIVVLKNRLSYIPNDLIEYNESFMVKHHDLDSIKGKAVIFGLNCFGRRGLQAMLELGMLKSIKE